MLSNEIKRLKMKKIKFEKKILKLDTYRRITLRVFASQSVEHYVRIVLNFLIIWKPVALPGPSLARPEDQNEDKNKDNLRKIRKSDGNLRKNEEIVVPGN